jgi:hypothetical protein
LNDIDYVLVFMIVIMLILITSLFGSNIGATSPTTRPNHRDCSAIANGRSHSYINSTNPFPTATHNKYTHPLDDTSSYRDISAGTAD